MTKKPILTNKTKSTKRNQTIAQNAHMQAAAWAIAQFHQCYFER